MSLTITTDIMCDRCSQWDRNVSVTGPRTNARLARKRAARRGWSITRGLELCPDCVKATEWVADLREEAAR